MHMPTHPHTHSDPATHTEVAECWLQLVCQEWPVACGELRYVTYGTNMVHATANEKFRGHALPMFHEDIKYVDLLFVL